MTQEEMLQELAYLRKVKDEDTALIISLGLQVQDLKRQRDNEVDEYKAGLRKEINLLADKLDEKDLLETTRFGAYGMALLDTLKIIDKTK